MLHVSGFIDGLFSFGDLQTTFLQFAVTSKDQVLVIYKQPISISVPFFSVWL